VTEPVYFCRGVADREQRSGYVADAGGIVAVRLDDGGALWRNPAADRPLICDGDRLAAASGHENAFELVVLDAGGEPVLVSAPVVLPECVTVVSWRPETFRMTASISDAELRLEWEARTRYQGGAAPSPQIRAAAAQDATGAVAIDLRSGAVAPLPAPPRDELAHPPLAPDEGAEPWRAGTTIARLAWDVGEGEQRLALELGDGTIVELMRGAALVAELTPDGLHVFVRDERGDDSWRAFSALTGRQLAALSHDAGAHSPVVLDDRAFYLVDRPHDAQVSRALAARDLASDARLWEAPLGVRPKPAARRLRQ
jgi:hypothetical protein